MERPFASLRAPEVVVKVGADSKNLEPPSSMSRDAEARMLFVTLNGYFQRRGVPLLGVNDHERRLFGRRNPTSNFDRPLELAMVSPVLAPGVVSLDCFA